MEKTSLPYGAPLKRAGGNHFFCTDPCFCGSAHLTAFELHASPVSCPITARPELPAEWCTVYIMGLHLAPAALGMEFPAFFHYFARKMVQKKVTETVMSFQMMDFGYWLGTWIDFTALTQDCDRVGTARDTARAVRQDWQQKQWWWCAARGDRHNWWWQLITLVSKPEIWVDSRILHSTWSHHWLSFVKITDPTQLFRTMTKQRYGLFFSSECQFNNMTQHTNDSAQKKRKEDPENNSRGPTIVVSSARRARHVRLKDANPGTTSTNIPGKQRKTTIICDTEMPPSTSSAMRATVSTFSTLLQCYLKWNDTWWHQQNNMTPGHCCVCRTYPYIDIVHSPSVTRTQCVVTCRRFVTWMICKIHLVSGARCFGWQWHRNSHSGNFCFTTTEYHSSER